MKNFPFLKKIDLHNNQIQSLEDFKDFLSRPKHGLEPNCLILQDNKIETLPDWLLYKTNLKTDLVLLGNPLDCSCDAVRKFSEFHQVTTKLNHRLLEKDPVVFIFLRNLKHI